MCSFGLEIIPVTLKIESDIFKVIDVDADLLKSIEKSIVDFQEWRGRVKGGNRKTKMFDNRGFRNETERQQIISASKDDYDGAQTHKFIAKLLCLSPPTKLHRMNSTAGTFGLLIRKSWPLLSKLKCPSDFGLKHKFVNAFFKPRLHTRKLNVPLVLSNVSVTPVLLKKTFSLDVSCARKAANFFLNKTSLQERVTTLFCKANICVDILGGENSTSAMRLLKNSPAIENVVGIHDNKVSIKNVSDIKNDLVITLKCDCGVNKSYIKTRSITKENYKSEKKIEWPTVKKNQSNQPDMSGISKNRTVIIITNQPATIQSEDLEHASNVSSRDKEKNDAGKKRPNPDFDAYKKDDVKKLKTDDVSAHKVVPCGTSETKKVHPLEPEEHRDNNNPKWQLYKVSSMSDALNFMLHQWHVPSMSDPHVDLTTRFSRFGQTAPKQRPRPQLTVSCTSLFDKRIEKADNDIHNINNKINALHNRCRYFNQYFSFSDQSDTNFLIEKYTKEKGTLENEYANLCDARHEVDQFYKFYKAEWISQYQKNENDHQRNVIFDYKKFYR